MPAGCFRSKADLPVLYGKTVNALHKQTVGVCELLTLIHLTFSLPCFNYIYSFQGGSWPFSFYPGLFSVDSSFTSPSPVCTLPFLWPQGLACMKLNIGT